jgi:hypothetical protein
MWLNFSAPTLLNLNDSAPPYKSELVVKTPKPFDSDWVVLTILDHTFSPGLPLPALPGVAPSVAHPIHLHGHDFVILAQSQEPYNPNNVTLKLDNPPRRDVALLPANGYLVIAFKADNPGVWLMHCHIAWHASSGLAVQIRENTDHIKLHNPAVLEETCQKWDQWFQGRNKTQCAAYVPFQDDSGI